MREKVGDVDGDETRESNEARCPAPIAEEAKGRGLLAAADSSVTGASAELVDDKTCTGPEIVDRIEALPDDLPEDRAAGPPPCSRFDILRPSDPRPKLEKNDLPPLLLPCPPPLLAVARLLWLIERDGVMFNTPGYGADGTRS